MTTELMTPLADRDARERHTPSSPWAIRTDALTKRFGDVAVVDGLDLEVPVGSVFGFLGPNGSGKTTTIRMLLGLIAPNAGHVELLGRPIPKASAEVLPSVGALVERGADVGNKHAIAHTPHNHPLLVLSPRNRKERGEEGERGSLE